LRFQFSPNPEYFLALFCRVPVDPFFFFLRLRTTCRLFVLHEFVFQIPRAPFSPLSLLFFLELFFFFSGFFSGSDNFVFPPRFDPPTLVIFFSFCDFFFPLFLSLAFFPRVYQVFHA